ncbi:MAG: putative damage-inducible protein DinB [Rhodothermales bacterium]|jgi:uncharacterized damage-inducible protein DinB
MSSKTLIHHNIAYLEQAIGLTKDVADEGYCECRPPFFASGIGDHLRHVIEHYQCFLTGFESGAINYDSRKRDRSISSDRVHAATVLRDLKDELLAIDMADKAVSVRQDGSDSDADAEPWSQSTIRRELQYLQAHTVHHYALIAFILRLQGREPSPSFGMAPSTLRHRKEAEGAVAS